MFISLELAKFCSYFLWVLKLLGISSNIQLLVITISLNVIGGFNLPI